MQQNVNSVLAMWSSTICFQQLRVFSLAVGLIQLCAAVQAAGGWYSDWNTAVSAARRGHKPLVALFEHEGCPDCARMERSLHGRSASAALDCAIKVRIETTQNTAVASRYGVEFTPTFLVLKPEGTQLHEVYREVGSMSESRIVQVAKSIQTIADQLEKAARSTDEETEKTPAATAKSVDKTNPADKPKPDTTVAAVKSRSARGSFRSKVNPASTQGNSLEQSAEEMHSAADYSSQSARYWPFW